MKFLNLAVSAAIGLAATVAAAVPIPFAYDAYPLAGGGVNFVTLTSPPNNVCAGDLMALVGKVPVSGGAAMLPGDTFDTVRVLYVATAPGTYNVACAFGPSGYVLNATINCAICATGGRPVTIPAGGTFPSVWQITFCFPVTAIGNNSQTINAGSNSTAFVPAFSNRGPAGAAPLNSDTPTNAFFFDLNRNCILEPPAELVTFSAAPAKWNLAAQIASTGCVPPPLFTCGSIDGRVVSIEQVHNMKAVEAAPIVSTRIDTKR